MKIGACECSNCTAADRADDNIERARAAQVTAICINCGKAFGTTAAHVLMHRGMARCCSPRRKQADR
ncbi:hypothetical protein IU421_13505 [Nocardia cyriacigeorgica]|uniref:hypothetical protein n=1 Tax=Nocardia cyriacigeorgica TaxID=135487 RepID=UPI001892F7FF|nr:hypothetical protein [Nocardia cyriacigeorgica]MBF6515298.1 hypothetical protein [Nocardia cyriacigeorgica]